MGTCRVMARGESMVHTVSTRRCVGRLGIVIAVATILSDPKYVQGQIPLGRFANPVQLGEIVNRPDSYEMSPQISSDGLTLYFSSNRSGFGGFDLYQATRPSVTEPFSEVHSLGPNINGSKTEAAANVSADGLSLYFWANDRNDGYGEADLYVATRTNLEEEFDNATNLGPEINTLWHEEDPHVTADGLTLYFASNRIGAAFGRKDIYQATRSDTSQPFSNVTNLTELGSLINRQDNDKSPSVSSNGLAMFFNSRSNLVRPTGVGAQHDIWVSTRDSIDQPFGDAVNLNDFSLGSQINTAFVENNASISFDWPAYGSQIYFHTGLSTDVTAFTDIWQATWVQNGDINANVGLDVQDIELLSLAIVQGNTESHFDVNQDSSIDAGDRLFWITNLAKSFVGDADLNGVFDSDDLIDVFSAGKYLTGEMAGWAEGDFDGDQDFDMDDLIEALAGGGYDMGPPDNLNTVPEPTSVVLMLLGLVVTAAQLRNAARSVSRID